MEWLATFNLALDMKGLRLILLIIGVIVVEGGLGRRWGKLPPMGKFLSPVEGFWRNAEPKSARPPEKILIPSLQSPVTIVWDKRWVPHIYAQSEADLFRVQGYLQAYLRLWQMEMQSDAAAGRLSRIFGAVALPHDRAMRRLGMTYATEKVMEVLSRDSLMKTVVEAFTEGINAYIAQLSPRDYPVEYKLLDYKPEPWSLLRSAFLVKYMAYDLATPSQDKYLTQLVRQIGRGAIDTLYPDEPPLGYPSILSGEAVPNRELPPQPPVYYSLAYAEDTIAHALEEPPPAGIGSNNWALSGRKTASGYPLLANDPHLRLTLPSIWLEMHLVAPTLNVYGVTLMGAPGIILGYNQAVAWGVTNVGPDGMDFYRVRYADSAQRTIYAEGGKVIPLHPRPETLWVRTPFGFQEMLIDTVWYTPWGPIVHRSKEKLPRPLFGKAREAPIDCACRWISYEPSNEARCFYELNHAKNLNDYKRALRFYGSPAQNFIYADTAGHIALWVRGYYPLRWQGQGKFVLDAERPEHHWQDWLTFEENPHAIDPPEGFLRSANSYPTAGRKVYPYYLGWYYVLPDRAARIEEELRRMEKATVDSCRLLQMDVLNFLAREALPIMLEYVKDKTSPWLDTLRAWDYRFRAESRAPTLFRRWWKAYHQRLWQSLALRPPEWEVSLKVMREVYAAQKQGLASPHPRWLSTAESDPRNLKRLLQESWEEVQRWADQAKDTLIWWRYRSTQLRHLARLPGFGSDTLRISGDESCINAVSPTAGPSWRMVVDLKPPVQGYGVYPGGQSGNPGSFQYAAFLPTWERGELYRHAFYPTPAAFPDSLILSLSVAKPN